MANEQGIERMPPPPAGAPVAKKSKVPMILGVVLALLIVRWLASGSSSASAGTGVSAASTASAGESSSNPILGKWNLVDPAEAAYCPTYQEFTSSKSTSTSNGETTTRTPVYDIKSPTLVIVGYGGSYIGNWTVTGPDDLTLGQVGPPPYGVPSFCKYHRA